jgi:hypothetical protein
MIADVTIHLSNDVIQLMFFFGGMIAGGVFGVAFERNAKETQTLWHKVKK